MLYDFLKNDEAGRTEMSACVHVCQRLNQEEVCHARVQESQAATRHSKSSRVSRVESSQFTPSVV